MTQTGCVRSPGQSALGRQGALTRLGSKHRTGVGAWDRDREDTAPGNKPMPGATLPAPGLHLHKFQHHKSHPDTRPWKQTDKKVVGTLERWGRPAPVSAEEGGGRVPALPMGLAF